MKVGIAVSNSDRRPAIESALDPHSSTRLTATRIPPNPGEQMTHEIRPHRSISLSTRYAETTTPVAVRQKLSLFLAGLLAIACFLPVASRADAEPAGSVLLLVSQSELDALPKDTPVAWSKKPTSPNGPEISIESPTHNATYEGPFPIKVAFLPGSDGYDVDVSTLKLEYKKAWGIDITDRVREFITGTEIDVEESELPRGRHTVEIEIADVAKNVSRQIFTVTIK
jgi:hypothetical protein